MPVREAILNANEKTCQQALGDFLSRYLTPAFGALPKKEIDLMVLDMLETLKIISSEPKQYELAQRLHISQSKAGGLLYDRDLRRLLPTDLDRKVRDVLKSPIVQKQSDLFALEIDNKLVLEHLRAMVTDLGHATDGSFSPRLVKLSAEAFAALIEHCLDSDEQSRVKKALVKAGARGSTLKLLLEATVKLVGKKLVENTIESGSKYFAALLEAKSDTVTELFTNLFSQS